MSLSRIWPRHVDGCGTRQRQTLLSQLVMDSCDIWIPATNLGYTKLNDGVLGFLGSVPFHIFGIFIGFRLESTLSSLRATTSYMSLQTQWRKQSAAGVRKTA